MRIFLLIVLAVLSGCGRVEKKAPPVRAITLDPVSTTIDVAPVVHVHFMYKLAWDSFFVSDSEDVDLTFPEALKRGVPAQLWLYLALFGRRDVYIPIYFVRPLKA